MRIGVLELLSVESKRHWSHALFAYLITKQYASIMPQAVSVWCREMGHDVFYATYYGQKDAKQLLPNDLDVVFIATYTQASARAYALAKLYRRENTLTVIGGPHAKAFPDDCLRFFDVVVLECDKILVADILLDMPRGQIVTSGRTLQDVPSVQERLPEIQTSALLRGRQYLTTTIPMLASVGCPYACDFCIDWDNPYRLLPLDRYAADLGYISENFPKAFIGYHDPNFAVKFDQMFEVLERLPIRARNKYITESSLSILRPDRLERLRDSGCYYIAPGVESWNGYSSKAGVGPRPGTRHKLEQVVEHFQLIHKYVPGIQANFVFGLDCDEGDEPIELTKEFISRAPFVWPTLNIPTPFGATPLYHDYRAKGRILTSMPFAFYFAPYLMTTIKNYDPLAYYEKLLEMHSHMVSGPSVLRRLKTTNGSYRFLYTIRAHGTRRLIGAFRRIIEMMKTDRQFRAFHEGESQKLPEFYQHQYDRLLGSYATLLSREDRQPLLPPAQLPPPRAGKPTSKTEKAKPTSIASSLIHPAVVTES